MQNNKLKKIRQFPRIMLVDMNSFFASVEQQANPFLRGKPVGVCASLHETSCLIAASKEAKTRGIKTGTLIYKAKKICPKIVLIGSEPEKYREVNRRMVDIFSDYTERFEVYSIDEAFLEIRNPKFANPLIVGAEIKRRIKQEIGEWLTCSVGIGSNKFLAKLAADLQKPDGLSVIWPNQLREVYKNKNFSDLWGLARGWTRRLSALGIHSPLQLLDYPVQNLISAFGKPGFYIWQRVNGLEIDKIESQSSIVNSQKSFGHSWVLNFRTVDKEKLKIVVMRLAEKAARRMRREGFIAYGMYLSVTLVDGNNLHCSKKLKFPISTGQELYEEALKIWKPWKLSTSAARIAVGYMNLKTKTEQLSLFNDNASKITQVSDRINDKYGEFTIRSGLLTRTSSFAPDAIAFGK